jgi:hypothetical protein
VVNKAELDQMLTSTWADESGLPRRDIPDSINNIGYRHIGDLIDSFDPISSLSKMKTFQ